MMGKNPSWLALSKQKSTLGKNRTKPEFTDRFLEQESFANKERTRPPESDFSFSLYKWSKYTINANGIVKSLSWEAMKYLFYPNKLGPRVRIRRMRKKAWDDKISSEDYEINILKLMKYHFGPYIEGYSEAKENLENYILLPKDGNWENLATTNLYFCSKKDYQERGSKRAIVKNFLMFPPNMTDKSISEKTWVSRAHISRVKSELQAEGKLPEYQKLLDLREKTGFQIETESLPIYEALLESQGKLSNSDIAKKLRPQERNQAKTNEEKRKLTDRVVRVRKKLTDAGLIPRFNANFEEKREQALQMIKEKPVTGKTNKEIAEMLGLKKEQIDNLARQIKKCLKSALYKGS